MSNCRECKCSGCREYTFLLFAVGVGLVFALALAGDVSEFPACVALVVGEVASSVASAAPSSGSPPAPTSSSTSTVRGGGEGGSHMLPDRFLNDCGKVRGGGAVATTIREASEVVDARRREARKAFPTDNMCPKTYSIHRRDTQPLTTSRRILKHLSPLWAPGIHSWQQVLSRSPTDQTVSFLPNPAILTALLGEIPITSPALTAAKGALKTLRQILSNPRDLEYL